ncbi:uncharacterized protein LOC125491931 [Beta vulgaris subsp. vulgaris]|uniref:uncharacterized protein LOC125491931 n=1 Tax=Beta vulgaris subsp. vulgaris TaxID=3555 RepID=UPI0020367154|nr:uncharacterized protein LOC125491931 [Beta vulgaris subsp. vulgaris]
MSSPLITAEALRAAKRRRLAKAGTGSSSLGAATGSPVVKLEADPSLDGGRQPPILPAPKVEPKEAKAEESALIKVEDLPASSSPATSSVVAVAVATASNKKKPLLEEAMRLPFSALSRVEMAARFDKASEHLVTELEKKACLSPDGQELSIRVLALARRSVPGISSGTASGEMSWDERQTLVSRLRLAEMRLSESEDSMAKSLKAFEEKKAELDKRHRAVAKDCKRAEEKIEKTRKSAEEAIAKARECREAVVLAWKESEEGKTFLENASLQASEIGQAEALRKVRFVLEKLAPSFPWSEVEEGVKALSQEEGPIEDQAPPSANLEG